MIAALFYLQLLSSKNRLVARLKRLKQPKYLAGAIVGGIYFWFYFFRHFVGSSSRSAAKVVTSIPAEYNAMIESVGALVLLVVVVLAWIIPHGRAALAFSEAEIAFLFPAPIRRRTLINYKLLKSQLSILLTSLFLTLISGRFGQGGTAWMHAVGWWLVLSTLNLHFLGSSFALARLTELGVARWQRRLGVALLALALAAVVVLWSRHTLPAPTLNDLAGVEAISNYVQKLAQSGPLPWLLRPFRWMTRPYLASDGLGFLNALWPVLGLMALHYLWVVRSNVSFEEASLDQARKRAEVADAFRKGGMQAMAKKRKKAPFTLSAVGPRPVALLWKNLISAGQMFTPRLWIMIALAVVVTSLALRASGETSEAVPVVGVFAGMATVWIVLAGPQIVRQDFRQDLPVADMLKQYPMRGWQVVLGELLAPAAVLSAMQWLLLLTGAILLTRSPDPDGTIVPVSARLAVGFGAAVVLPVLNLVSLLIPNAAVLLWPAWMLGGRDGAQGIEVMGQRIIAMLGQVLALVLALVPAAAAFALVFFGAKLLIGWVAAVPLAAVAAALVLAVEAGFGIFLLGRLFEKLDLSAESTN